MIAMGIALILNALMLVVLVMQIIEHGNPRLNSDQFYLFILLFAAPAINIFLILSSNTLRRGLSSRDNWLAAAFRRKAVEQERRIASLESGNK
jgi:hypothetical protein